MNTIDKQEFLLDAIYNYSEDMVTIKDLDMKYVTCNKAFLNLMNKQSPDEVIGKTLFELHPPEKARIVAGQMKMVIESGEMQTYMLYFDAPNGNKIYRETSTPIISNGVIKGVLSITVDVTREEILREKLMEKNSQLNTLLENLPMLVYMKDNQSKLMVASEAAKEFAAKGIDKFNDVQIDLDWMASAIVKEDGYVIKNKKSLIRENCAKDVNGKSHWYRIHKAPILNPDNEVEGLVTIAQNINLEKEIENQKNLFLATLSHDLKNPLQAQISSLELFYKGFFGTLTEAQKEMIEMILESSKYMKTMLCSLMQTCKDNNGMIHLEKQYFDIEALMQKCIREATDLGTVKNIKILYKSNFEQPVMYFGDEIQVRRVIGNLLNNAFNYAIHNTEIVVEMYVEEKYLYMTLENISEPISEDLAKIIFDKYVCGQSLQNNINVGLGLYFCKKIVEAHEGEISLKTDKDKNAFTIKVPLLTEENTYISEIAL